MHHVLDWEVKSSNSSSSSFLVWRLGHPSFVKDANVLLPLKTPTSIGEKREEKVEEEKEMEFENLTSSGGAMEHHCPALNNKVKQTLDFRWIVMSCEPFSGTAINSKKGHQLFQF